MAGVAEVVGKELGAGDPWLVSRGLNVLWLLATGALVLVLARLLWPRRPRLHLARWC